MPVLRALSRSIDRSTAVLGRTVAWLVVAMALISAGNAVIRKLFDSSSNAWLELQWWLFGIVFLLAAPWTLAANEHIRIDIVSKRWSPRTRTLIDILGHVAFLLPMCAVVVLMSWPSFLRSAPSLEALQHFVRSFDATAPLAWLRGFAALGEQSSNAGGLPQWPMKALIPIAFSLLFIQGLSELSKRICDLIRQTPPTA